MTNVLTINKTNTKTQKLDVLARKLVNHWEQRAQVKQPIPIDISLVPEKSDFPIRLLPFNACEWEIKYGAKTIDQICSLAWLSFNNKVISIESNILVPCCKALMDDAFAHNDVVSFDLLAQAQTDEAYHVFMAHKSMSICREYRSIPNITFPKCRIIQEYESFECSDSLDWQKQLNIIAATVVTEVLIKGALSPISRNDTIQEFNRYITNMHLIDETAHGSIFRIIAHKLLLRLNGEKYDFFVERMRESIGFFNDIDINTWVFILLHCGIDTNSEILEELRSHQPPNDYSELDKLLTETSRAAN